jgi:hypothetical protein
MLSAIGATPFTSSTGASPSVAGLRAQLDRCRQQLSDCVDCSPAKTLQGKEAIQTLSNKIGEIKTRIEKVLATKKLESRSLQFESEKGH